MKIRSTTGRVDKVRNAFIHAATAKNYRAALRLAFRLRGQDQLKVLDALFAAAERLKVDRQTGGAILESQRQELDGSISITWSQRTKRPDGSEARIVSSALLEPADRGPGWKASTEIPDEIVEAVTRASL